MKKTIITGCDGSLGQWLMGSAKNLGRLPMGISMSDSESSWAAEIVLGGLLSEHEPDELILCHGVNFLSALGAVREGEEERAYLEMTYRMISANLVVPRDIIDYLARHSKKPMRVVFISSQTYRVAQRNTSLYCATKAGAAMLMKVAARELAPKGWVINALAPGLIEDTEMSWKTGAQVRAQRGWSEEEARTYALGLVPAGRFTSRGEVADAVFALLDMPSYVNGTIVDMTGGV